MSRQDLEPHRLARLDQWNAMLDQLVAHAARHWAEECVKPVGTCIGGGVADELDQLQPVVTEMLLELAIVRLAQGGANAHL
jgi:hypothetical protein